MADEKWGEDGWPTDEYALEVGLAYLESLGIHINVEEEVNRC